MKNLFLLIILFVSQHCFGIQPDTVYKALPSALGLKYQDIKIRTTDNFNLSAWIIEPANSDSNTQTLIIAHQDAGNMSDVLIYGYYLHFIGLRVIMFDYRGFGKSSYFKIDSNYLYYEEFEEDLSSVVGFVSKKYNTKVSILGLSMGSLLTLNILKQNKEKINKLIFDGLVANPQALIDQIFLIKHEKIIYPTFDKTNVLVGEHNVLVFLGNNEKYIPMEDVLNFQKVNKKVEIILYNGEHLAGSGILGEKYFRYIEDFLNH